MSYVHFIKEDSVVVLDTSNGKQVKFFSSDERYQKAIALIRDGEYDSVFDLDVKNVITSFFEGEDEYRTARVVIEDGAGYIYIGSYPERQPLHDAIVKRIMKMKEQGFDATPMLNFLSRLYDNPSKTAIDELFLFIDACELPITDDGCFIAYKIVRNDYKDLYTGKMDNSVGSMPMMPRHLVDDNRHNTCSRGLHFCSKGYLKSYGTGQGNRCMLVKVNPTDVVAIPSDYNNAKGRAWTYEVIGEVEGDWREDLTERDFTDKSVVHVENNTNNQNGNTNSVDNGVKEGYYYDEGMKRYRRTSDGRVVKTSEAIK